MSKKVLNIIAGIVIVGGGIFVWKNRGQDSEEPVLNTAKVERGNIASTISVSGNLIQTNTFTITTSVTGVVKEVFVKDGEVVQKGKKLVELILDQVSEEKKISRWAAYLSAQNSLASARENELFVEKAEADLGSAWLSYQLASPIIVAPQAGKVADISVVPGMVASSATPKLLSIVDEQQLLVSVSINEIDIPQIITGQKVELIFDAFPDQNFSGEVVGIDHSGIQTQGVVSYGVLVGVDAKENNLYSNMTATAEIITDFKENVLWVPAQAVVDRRGEYIVMVLRNEESVPKAVEIGLETTTQTEIISGLSEGDVVIVSGQDLSDKDSPFGGAGGIRNMMRPGGNH